MSVLDQLVMKIKQFDVLSVYLVTIIAIGLGGLGVT